MAFTPFSNIQNTANTYQDCRLTKKTDIESNWDLVGKVINMIHLVKVADFKTRRNLTILKEIIIRLIEIIRLDIYRDKTDYIP